MGTEKWSGSLTWHTSRVEKAENCANGNGSAQWSRSLGGTTDASPSDTPSSPRQKPEPFHSRPFFSSSVNWFVLCLALCSQSDTFPPINTSTTSAPTETERGPFSSWLSAGGGRVKNRNTDRYQTCTYWLTVQRWECSPPTHRKSLLTPSSPSQVSGQ